MPNASYRQLIVWQRAIDLTFAVYAATDLFPKNETFGLASQMRRAAVSIPSNIAEGQARATKGEFKQFLGVARGSLAELQTQLIIARGLQHYATTDLLHNCDRLADEVHKMLSSLVTSLRSPTPKR